MKEYEYKVIQPDGHWGWLFARSYKKADESARDWLGEFVIVIPTGRVIEF